MVFMGMCSHSHRTKKEATERATSYTQSQLSQQRRIQPQLSGAFSVPVLQPRRWSISSLLKELPAWCEKRPDGYDKDTLTDLRWCPRSGNQICHCGEENFSPKEVTAENRNLPNRENVRRHFRKENIVLKNNNNKPRGMEHSDKYGGEGTHRPQTEKGGGHGSWSNRHSWFPCPPATALGWTLESSFFFFNLGCTSGSPGKIYIFLIFCMSLVSKNEFWSENYSYVMPRWKS